MVNSDPDHKECQLEPASCITFIGVAKEYSMAEDSRNICVGLKDKGTANSVRINGDSTSSTENGCAVSYDYTEGVLIRCHAIGNLDVPSNNLSCPSLKYL